ncbi:uncharacterized protein LAESUDRAFT_115096 [Laetiporus sulphureus 93-53]|uniref:Uncharacterized protein n=1 Tax=Laetiporus sulphureus 93-53 TaxID=1314785 RepID=A0A165EQB6_9APHY|nr:uncharacterized protein LAESUDRAFT_115096 [Laetiporus sulphureus 93-53]KZT07544.1 hypothetical protein LAESUDRAFT_115096 [Laetiporus sulphureus 93-53]
MRLSQSRLAPEWLYLISLCEHQRIASARLCAWTTHDCSRWPRPTAIMHSYRPSWVNELSGRVLVQEHAGEVGFDGTGSHLRTGVQVNIRISRLQMLNRKAVADVIDISRLTARPLSHIQAYQPSLPFVAANAPSTMVRSSSATVTPAMRVIIGPWVRQRTACWATHKHITGPVPQNP